MCKFIIDVYLLNYLLGQGGEYTFIQKKKHSHLPIYNRKDLLRLHVFYIL